MSQITHLDASGKAQMVDVSDKAVTVRMAQAHAVVSTAAVSQIVEGSVPKGDVLAVARVAGIQAAKKTPELVPLCHPIAVHSVSVDLVCDIETNEVQIDVTVKTADRTGVEMEALTAASVAGLTVIDMVKALDPRASLHDVAVLAKSGGKSGQWVR